MNKTLGIDLGTTFCAVSYIENGNAVVIPNSFGNLSTPSVLWTDNDSIYAGEDAARKKQQIPANAIEYIKREIGKPLGSDPGEYSKTIWGEKHASDELSAVLLYKLVQDANKWLKQNKGFTTQDVIITVPAYFNDLQRHSTKLAGELAGLNVKDIINEPTAAAISHSISQNNKSLIKVFDLGGGTFDTTLMQCYADGSIEVFISDGDYMLGGKNWDENLKEYIIDELKDNGVSDSAFNFVAQQKILDIARASKIELSSKEQITIKIPADVVGKEISFNFTRQEFNIRSTVLLQQCKAKCNNVIEKAKRERNVLGWNDVDKFVLVGGSSRMPMIQNLVKTFYSGNIVTGDFDLAISKGAAFYSIHSDKVKDVSPKALGLAVRQNGNDKIFVMIERDKLLPVNFEQEFTAPEKTELRIVQGDEGQKGTLASVFDYKEIGRIKLNNSLKMQVKINYKYSKGGMLEVSAKDQSGNEKSYIVNPALNNNGADDIQSKRNRVNQLVKKMKSLA